MILDNQTNKVYISELTLEYVNKEQANNVYQTLLAKGIDVELLKHTNEGWCRDYMPIQVAKNKFIQYRYYPDYLRRKDRLLYITDPTEELQSLGIETIKTDLVIDGGNVVKCPDCVIMTDKVFRENPQKSYKQVIEELERLFECEILFLPFDPNEEYGHADGIVRYIGNGKVLMTNYKQLDSKVAKWYREALSRKFDVIELHYNTGFVHEESWAYINFLQTDKFIVVPALGIPEDEQAMQQIEKVFPEYKGNIFSVRMEKIVKDGGAMNCITWNIKI